MSKIGRANLSLQEQADELGFESLQSALDCGYKTVWCEDGEMKLVQDADVALLEAHIGYLIKKETIINKLEMLIQDTESQIYKEVLREAIDFIKEGEV